MFFQNVWVHFEFPKSIISDRDSRSQRMLVKLMGTHGHQVEKKHKIQSTNQWSDRIGE